MASNSVKILHTSEIQLGRKFPQLGRAGDLVRSAIKETFERTIKVALDDGVDGVIIAGNLFAANLVSRNLIDFTMRQIERLGRIPVTLVPGNCDALDETSLYKHLQLRRIPSNLTILGLEGRKKVDYPNLGFTVHGLAAGSGAAQLPSVGESQDNLQILVLPVGAESTDSGEYQLSELAQQAVAADCFDYIAVGGTFGFSRWGDNVVSSGSPEGIDFVQGEPGRVVLAEISRERVDLAHREVGKLKWVDLEFHSDSYRFTLEVERELQSHVDAQTVLRARLTGRPTRDGFIDVPALRRRFDDSLCRFIVTDERQFDSSLIDNLPESSSNLVNEFTALVREGYDNAPPELQAGYLQSLSTGRALLSGKDVM